MSTVLQLCFVRRQIRPERKLDMDPSPMLQPKLKLPSPNKLGQKPNRQRDSTRRHKDSQKDIRLREHFGWKCFRQLANQWGCLPHLTMILRAPNGVTRMAGANAYAVKFATSPTITADKCTLRTRAHMEGALFARPSNAPKHHKHSELYKLIDSCSPVRGTVGRTCP